ncbi:MAG: POT-type proton-dependent oligopeptide transporter [Mucilaginibacter sp.]|uniref:POT-type proton-dependent oligopeptide transporter n=1 Tax=Mucilaginibacter sp. L3T2-6 TaxID=3062491 RepID=UPI0026766BEE|nr:MFS transporter [Mucilaginibacter sp. L3T2-6]MDO3644054.1 MFS transporter [Mucilaginibacter sp. L3T2-6]MDV6216505.1 MFS transporter [Mucilaginibacter sp. L3T2-6]
MQETATAAPVKKSRFPKAVPYIIGNEAAERFSFYGMRSVLSLFLVKQFFNPTDNAALTDQANAHANKLHHLFVMVAYALPFVGGMIADWYTGKYKLILYVSIVYCIGHLMLATFDGGLTGFELGLLVVAIGAGGIKSCVSANVGDQFDATNQDLLSKVYGWFYFSINAGSMISTIAIPWTYEHFGPKWAFGIPGLLMALATIIFFSGRKMYVKVPPQGVNRNNLVFITWYALTHSSQRKPGQSMLDVAKGPYDPERVEGVKAVYRVMAVFFFALAFWAVWDQCLSEWTLYAEKMDRVINLGFTTVTIFPGQLSTFNTVFLLMFIPLFNYVIYPWFDKIGIKTTPLRRLGTGLIITALSFVVIGFTHASIESGNHPSIWWQVFAFVLLSAAEVLVSITGLEYAYTHSPKSMKSTMTGIWFLVVSFGNLITALVNSFIEGGGWWARNLKGANYEWFFVTFIMVFVIVFLFVSPRMKERNYITDPVIDAEVASNAEKL